MNSIRKIIQIIVLIVIIVVFPSCEKLVEVGDPRSELAKKLVFSEDLTATAAVAGLYQQMTAFSFVNFTLQPSLASDDLAIEGSPVLEQFYQNELSANSANVEGTWRNCYAVIYTANAILEGLQTAEFVSAPLKVQLLGEARFFRAFYHFYLVNLFGSVPYITKTDYNINRSVKRMAVDEVYVKIIEDLTTAQAQLTDNYKYSSGERVRVNKWAASALLARIFLYTKNWGGAEVQASNVIANTGLYTLESDLNNVFLKNNNEAIWQLMADYPQLYTTDGAWLFKPNYNPESPKISNELFDAFESTDKRRTNWIQVGQGSSRAFYFSAKYKETSLTNPTGKEYSTVLRLAEQYLIRAEARAKQNNLTGTNSAVSDLNVIRSRAGLLSTTESTQASLIAEIETQRRLEFFAEYGHRWFDLKRTDRINTILPMVKANWKSTDVLYPIPTAELTLNPNITPNPGY